MTDTTVTTGQAEALGGNTWTNPSTGAVRVYLNNWTGLCTSWLTVPANRQNVAVDGSRISNSRSRRLLADVKVYVSEGHVVVEGAGEYADRIEASVTEAVAAVETPDSPEAEQPAGTAVIEITDISGDLVGEFDASVTLDSHGIVTAARMHEIVRADAATRFPGCRVDGTIVLEALDGLDAYYSLVEVTA